MGMATLGMGHGLTAPLPRTTDLSQETLTC